MNAAAAPSAGSRGTLSLFGQKVRSEGEVNIVGPFQPDLSIRDIRNLTSNLIEYSSPVRPIMTPDPHCRYPQQQNVIIRKNQSICLKLGGVFIFELTLSTSFKVSFILLEFNSHNWKLIQEDRTK